SRATHPGQLCPCRQFAVPVLSSITRPTEPSGFTELDFIPGQGTPAFG
ncbi:MAG: hypothetical protein, partial [Olavius algarvensis Gamma 3 endosymbiont]